jgi:hypothetical protein
MQEACAGWALENNLSIVPVDLRKAREALDAGAAEEALYDVLRRSLWRRDLFDDSEPVRSPSEFFGRELVVDGVLGKVYAGQPLALIGLRKIGKSSVLTALITCADRSSRSV